MTLRKDIPTSHLRVTETRPSKSSGTMTQLFGLVLEIPPVAYVAVTGQLPAWARWWMVGWLSLWLLINIVQAAEVRSRGRS